MKKIYFFCCFSLYLFFGSTQGSAQIQLDSTVVDTHTVKTGLNTVWELIYGDDGWIWYTERIGKISKINPETKQNILLAVIPDVYEDAAGGKETGLLGMALHPNFSDTPIVFIVYNYLDGNSIKEKLVSYTYAAGTLHENTVILNNINGANVHVGSRIIITPDRKIIMTTGDAGNQNNAQNLNTPEGKFLRMNTDGTVPPDNPLDGKPYYAWGTRNSQGLVLVPNGILYSSEHGSNSDDELNIIMKGRNYGWPVVNGFCNSPDELQFCQDSDVVEPLISWTPTIAPAGIDYYFSNAIPEFNNAILLCTLKEQDLRANSFSPTQEVN